VLVYNLREPIDSSPSASESVRAFPGAEGLAALTRGAAGYSGVKSTVIVDSLADSGTGTLREAIEGAGQEGTFVTFEVSGIINLTTLLDVTSDYITIAGQTSPGGICLAGYPIQVGNSGNPTSHFIMRHVRSIAGEHEAGWGNPSPPTGTDAEAFRIWQGSDVMVDHCSFAWGGDEVLSVTDNGGTACRRVTLSRCFITQGLTDVADEADHGFGLFFNLQASGGASTVEAHHCFIAHHQWRMPQLSGDAFYNLVNNVIYDFDKFLNCQITNSVDNGEVNYIGNYLKEGTNSEGPYTGAGRGGDLYCDSGFSGGTPYEFLYMLNNMGYVRTSDSDAEWTIVDWNSDSLLPTSWQSDTEFTNADQDAGVAITKDVLLAATMESQAAAIVADCGATKPSRDSHDTAMAADFNAGTGTFKASSTYPGDWPTYSTPSAPTDTNNDGIPDDWTSANMGGDAWDDEAPSGYLWIEEYVNELA